MINQLICGNNIKVVSSWKSNYVDGIVTDPPYELGFMGKGWDSSGIAYSVPMWRQMLRITKPGGFLLCFGGTHTFHRLACAIEDAGWEIRDCMMWLYGCLSEDTEILTKKGWKLLHKTTKNDIIMVYDTANNIYKWETPQRWNVYRVHKDTAYHIKSDTTDQIVSKEHHCLVERGGKLIFKQAWELSEMERMPVLPQDFYPMEKGLGNILFPFLQRKIKSKKSCKVQQQYEGAGTKRQKIWFRQSCLERWYNLFQKEGKLRQIQNKICQVSKKIFGYGSQRRLCYGTQTIDSPADGQMSIKNRGGSSQRPQPREQFNRKPSTFPNKQSPQITRSKVSKIEYNGLMFCPTVSTGAFIARRKGKIFITGNSGFPKSHNISKAIDKAAGAKREVIGTRPVPGYARSEVEHGKQNRNKYEFNQTSNEASTLLAEVWQGYGTALKPAWEPIIVAMKPLDGTFAHNAERHGVAGLNIDGGRIGTETREYKGSGAQPNKLNNHEKGDTGIGYADGMGKNTKFTATGRWPANLILDEEAGAMLDEQSGNRKGWTGQYHNEFNPYGGNALQKSKTTRKGHYQGFKDSGGASRFFYCAKTSRKERNMGMEDCENKLLTRSGGAQGAENRGEKEYLQKHIGLNRVAVVKNNHPTVKPLSLMKYLCTLLKMPGHNQIILDPFMGSGTTGIACASLGIGFIGIEKESDYCEISAKRIAAISGQTLPVTKNVETFRATRDSAGGGRRPNESLPHVSEHRQSIIDAAVLKLKAGKKI